MTITYPIRATPTPEQDRMLKYSLRSVEQYGQGVSRVMMVGKRRPWFSDKVEMCDLKDEDKQIKFHKVARRLVTFCAAGIPFVLMNDDFIFGQDYNFTDRRWFTDGTIYRKRESTANSTYRSFIEKTMRRLDLDGTEPSHMNHTPMLVLNPKAVAEFWNSKKMWSAGNEISFRQTVGHLLTKQSNFIERDDVKIRSGRNAQQWEVILQGDIVSLSPQCTDAVMWDALEKKFPNKSIWEK